MGVLTLNVVSTERGTKKTMQFEPSTLVHDACKVIRDKMGMNDTNPQEYGLFRVQDDETQGIWMENGRQLEYYLIRNNDRVEYKKKIRLQKVRMLDGAVKTIPVDESQVVGQLMLPICNKIGISNYEEYSLVREDENTQNGRSTLNLRDQRERSVESDGRNKGGLMMGTLGRKKEQKMEQLRQKLHTDEELAWVDHSKTLREQAIGEDETLLLRRKYFFSDTNVDSRDPVQLNLLYVQCRDGVLRGLHPVDKEIACQLGALQCQIQYGDFPYNKPKFQIDGRDVLPKEYAKNKENEKKIVQNYKELSGTNELDAKSKYVHLCRELRTYGVTFFVVKEKVPGKNKLVPRLFGVNKESVMRVDEKTKQVLKEWPLEQVRRWASSGKTFNLDFGDYQEGYYCVQTPDGEKIGQLIGGYIDIILKKKRTKDHQGIEGDEGSTMLEDVVAPARATLVAHGQIGAGQHAVDAAVAVKGVLRTPQSGYGINGAQYGAVSGELQSQSLGRAQRLRVIDTYEHPQRALIGTIEATIRAVDEAEEELDKEPYIELPKFHDDASERKWVEEQVAVNKENVNERLAAMGAATAQVVQWTAVQDEYDERVGTAVATIGSNLPDVSRNVRHMTNFMETTRSEDLVQATRRLCNAFGDFLTSVNPEHQEKRTTVLAAAGRVGDFSQQVINTMDEPTDAESSFQDQLVQKAKNVATSTAQLVLRAKTVSADCQEPALQEKVIHSATQCAFATSQLVACARVVAPTIENPSCQDQLHSAAKQVSHSVEELLIDSETACYRSRGDGQRALGDIHSAARQVTHALDSLLDHVKTSPRSRRVVEEEQYNEILRRTNRIIAHQGPSEEMTREAKKVIRHSQLLQEQIETEARERPEQKDRLLDAARKVATATSNMIEATRECESRPTEAESEMALRNAAERLATVTNETTSEQQARYIMERLEEAAKATAYDATQTIAAANSAKEIISTRSSVENLVYECTQTAEHVPKLITCIRESQQAQSDADKFRAQSRLIRQSNEIVSPATRLVESSRNSINSISEQHVAAHLHETSSSLSNSLVKLRTALNAAQQLNFNQQLVYSEALIRELDAHLQDTERMAQARQLHPQRGVTAASACTKLMSTSRHVGSSVAQLVTAASTNDEQHIGASAVELAQNLRDFTEEVRDVLAVRPDVNIKELVVAARTVVHESGTAFDRVRENAPANQLSEVARQVANSLRKVIACIPDNQHIESAIQEIRKVSANTPARETDVRSAAQKLVEATSELLLTITQPTHNEAVNAFVSSYTNFHTAVIAAIKNLPDMPARIATTELLERAREEAISVLSRSSLASTDISHMQQLAEESKQFTTTVNQLVDSLGGEEPWQRECDAALRQIQAVRHLAEQATVPVNDDSYFGSLDRVTEEARRLGEAMTGIARNAKNLDTASLCSSVRSSADAVCRLAEAANQSAYLVGVANPRSVRGRAAVVDGASLRRSAQLVKQVCDRIIARNYSQEQLLNDTTIAAKHTSSIANMCRNASERSSNVNVKKHLVNSAKELAARTSALITAVRAYDTKPTPETESVCTETASELRSATEQLEHFIENPDFGALPGQISDEGRVNQRPVLNGTRQMLDASAEMIRTARSLASAPRDSAIWQRLADNSRDVSDSIKGLVAGIRDAAPGQAEMDRAIEFLQKLIGEIERSAMDAYKTPNTVKGPQKRMQQQVGHALHALEEKVDGLRIAAKSKGEDLPHCVEDHCRTTEALVIAACQAAGLSTDSATQAELFERAKTVVEAELEMMIACRDAGGNQKAVEAHRRVDEAAEQLKDALSDMRTTVGKISSDEGVVEGIVDNIAHSIESTDNAAAGQGTFADVQTRMVSGLEAIRAIANDMPYVEPNVLGGLAVNMSEKYRGVAMDARQAITMLTNPDLSHRLKLAVQKLGNSCIQTVKTAGKKRAYPTDQRMSETLLSDTKIVVERVEEVLAALHEGSKGTQACINAANTVSGIIGDLDTTILFATSGSLNPTDTKDFHYHKDVILKTAKALVEDTKALVAGAASNQEQLAVAAQNAVRTIVNLSDAVKNGAVSLSSDNAEAQVLVIHAVRDVAAALSALIQATKNASGRSLHDPAMSQLKDAAKVMVSNVTSLLKTVKSVEERKEQGVRAIEAAVDAIMLEIKQYDIDGAEGSGAGIGPGHLESATSNISEAAQRLTTAAQTTAEADVTAAGNFARQAVSDMLRVTRAAASEADSTEIKYKIKDYGRSVALEMRNLLMALHAILTRSSDSLSRDLLIEAARGVSRAIGDLTGCCEALKSDGWYQSGTSAVRNESAASAENELLGAASSIEVAAVKLAELRPRVQQNAQHVDESLPFDEQILSAAKSIMTAVQTLVKAASAAQRELVAQGRVEGSARTPDHEFSQGLISAAHHVVAAVHQLCEAANGLVQGQASEEKLISAAKQVASSTAHVLVACNVKADMESQAKRRLQAAGHAVKTATERLVAAARQHIVEDERNIIIADRVVTGIAQVMDAQEQVLRKERELIAAREQLANLNKARYEKSASPKDL